MNDDQLLRYSRHILLDEVGIEGQQRILDAHALVIGAGGLGCTAALFLAASGLGKITLIDHDTVDLTNLQRQIGHTTERVGTSKVQSLATAIRDLNPTVEVRALQQRADAEVLSDLVPQSSVVLDCSDNYKTRHLINAACIQHGVPLVSASVIRFDGQISVFDPRVTTSPCYACLFPAEANFEEAQCATMGVLAPLVGVMGSMQATEAIKLLSGAGSTLTGKLMLLDGRSMEWTYIHTQKSQECKVCCKNL